MTRILLLLAAILLAFGSLSAQQEVPIGEYLNPDGSLNLESGFNGSLDTRGWRMTTAADGSPRFRPVAADDTTYRNVDGDEYWDDRFGPPGSSGMVNAIAVSGENVYVGGRFVTMGDVVAHNIACWNTRTEIWSVLGQRSNEGVGGPVYSIAIKGEDIYVGGTFQNAGTLPANGIARWNRTRNVWSALREGLRRDVAPNWRTMRGGDVYAMAFKGDSLFVGGRFGDPAKGMTAPGSDYSLMLWHTRLERWFSIGSPNGYIRALVVHGTDLYAGGLFGTINGVIASNIARYDMTASAWQPLGSGISDTVHALAFDSSGSLYAGGQFDRAGDVAAANIARWDGTRWHAIGMGAEGSVDALTADRQGTIHVGGRFLRAGGQLCNGVARWNGAAWAPTGSGVGVSRNATSRFNRPGEGASHPGIIYQEYEIRTTRDPQIAALAATADDELYGGGMFSTAGTVTAHNVARWNTRRWRPVIRVSDLPASINGVDGQVYAVALSGEYLYVGGDFTRAGDIAAQGIARWNTVTGTWSTLGVGIGGPSPFVRALVVRGGTIVVGGIFTTAGGAPASGIASWDGSRWSSLDSGMRGETPYVFALVYHGNELYAAGAFSSAGATPNPEGIDANRIARWDGSVWHPLGAGIRGEGSEYAYVTSLVSGPGGLYAAGEFRRAGAIQARRIARWDGTAWSPLSEGLDGLVSALVSDGTTIYAGGEFTGAGTVPVSRIARWNGSAWSAVGTGMNAPVRSLAILPGGSLYAGGEFTEAGTPIRHLARWDGVRWNMVGNDTANGTNGVISAITGGGGSVFVGGFFSVAAGMGAQNIAEWDGSAWTALGSDPAGGLYGTVVTVAINRGDVYVGGLFDAVGGMRASGIARWDGVKWTRLGKGVDSVVRAIAFASNGDLYAGGEFRMAGDLPVNGIARWDGSAWHALDGGVDGNIYALAVDGGALYAAGRFQRAGTVGAANIARWNLSSGGWSPLGSGLAGNADSYVAALAAGGGTLYAGGRFGNAGGTAAANIARWDGTTWRALGGGVSSQSVVPTVYALAIGPQRELYVGGAFSKAGDVTIRNVAEWRDSGWSALGVTGIFGNEPGGGVFSLSYGPSGLYAGGQFVIADFVQANGLARWNGVSWNSLGSGVVSDYELARVTSVVADTNGDLYAGGTFTIAGGKPSYYFAIWHPSGSARFTPRGPAASRMRMLSAWPNPLSTSSRLEIDLAGSGPVELSISSLDGRGLATLIDEHVPAGRRVVEWDAAGLDAGIYIYTLRTSAGVESGRLVVVR